MIIFIRFLINLLAALLMMSMPVVAARFLLNSRQFGGASWKVFGIGALCFIASQLVHVPLVLFLLNPLLRDVFEVDPQRGPKFHGASLFALAVGSGLLAGLCEETSRWIFFRYWLRPLVSDPFYPKVVMFGIGHGGCEAIIVGIMAFSMLITATIVPTEEEVAQIYWASSEGQFIMAPIERVLAMSAHVAMSLLVWEGYFQSRGIWLALGIAFHTALDAVYLFVRQSWGVYVAELALGITFFPLSIYIVVYFAESNKLVFEPLSQDDDDGDQELTDFGGTPSSTTSNRDSSSHFQITESDER